MNSLNIEISFIDKDIAQFKAKNWPIPPFLVNQIWCQESTEYHARNILPSREAIIMLFQNSNKYGFEVTLNEWLEALTNFIRKSKTEKNLVYREELLISGDVFQGEFAKDIFIIHVYTDRKKMENIAFSSGQMYEFHEEVRKYFLKIAKKVTRPNELIKGLNIFSLE